MRKMRGKFVTNGEMLNRRSLISGAAGLLTGTVLMSGEVNAQTFDPLDLVGTWSGEEANAYLGAMAVVVVFFADGSYRRTHQLGDLMTYDIGDYSVAQNWIHFRLKQYGPEYYKGRRMVRPMSDTWVVKQFNGDVLRATVGGDSVVTITRTNN